MQNINCEGNCGGSYPICSLTHCFGCGLYKCAKEGCSNFTHLRGEREFNFHCKRGICTDFIRFSNKYETLLNIVEYQNAVVGHLRRFFAKGEVVTIINGHNYMQVLAISPPLDQGLLMDRVLNTENPESRDDIMKHVLQFISRLGIDLNQVTVVMDDCHKVRLGKYGQDIKPILSTAAKHLRQRLMETLENLNVNDADGSGLYSPTSYEFVRSNVMDILSYEAFKANVKANVFKTTQKFPIREGFDWRTASDNINDYLPPEVLDELVPNVNGRLQVMAMMRVEMQNALDAIFLLAALELDDRQMLVKYGDKFLSLVDMTRHEVSGSITDRYDHFRTIARLVSNAKTNPNFSLGYYNMALSYEMSSIHLSQILTTPYVMKNPVIRAGYENVNFRRPITFPALLTPAQQVAVKRINVHCDTYSSKKGKP